jgi:hypothetical protein
MSDELDPLPSTLAALVADLEARGFTVAERRSSTERTSINEFWAETILRRAGPVDAVRLYHDRLLWGVDVALEGQFHNLYDVRLALDDAKHKSRALSHDERRTMTLEVVDPCRRTPPRWLRSRGACVDTARKPDSARRKCRSSRRVSRKGVVSAACPAKGGRGAGRLSRVGEARPGRCCRRRSGGGELVSVGA